jgi:hypothetical protein
MTDAERHELADRLNDAWDMLRRVPGGSDGLADVCLEAARLIRPAVSDAPVGNRKI